MKKALIFAAGLLIALTACKKNEKCSTAPVYTPNENDTTTVAFFPVAYVNTDTLLAKYEFAKQKNDELQRKQENSRLTLTQKGQKLQKDYEDVMKKLQNGIYATRERAEQEQNRILKQQQELETLEAKLTQELLEENDKINHQLRDSLNAALKVFNADGRYKMIFSNTVADPTILQADPSTDITTEVLELLNARLK